MSKVNFQLKVAFRNLRRRPKRTVFLILGIALANALTIWILTFRESAHDTVMENVLGIKYGQEQITKIGYYDFQRGMLNPHASFSKTEIGKLPETYALRVQSTALLATETNALPVLLNGYELSAELAHSKLSTVLPRDFRLQKKFGLVLGRRLAKILGVQVGDEIGVIGQAIDGSVANELFTVEKILDLGGGEFEKSFAITSVDALQEFLSLPADRVHLLVNFEAKYPKHIIPSGLEVVPWKKLLPEIASSSAFMEKFTRFYAGFFALVAALAMANTLSLSFLERMKEYRMCTIIGASSSWLRGPMAFEIGIIMLTSMGLGNLLILFVLLVFSFFPLNLSILTGGPPLQIGGIILSQDVVLKSQTWIFVASNLFFLVTQTLASIYPLRVILKKNFKVGE